MEEKLIFPLSKPVEFTKKGAFETTHSIELDPPNMASLNEAYDLSQLVMGAMMDARRFASESDEGQGGKDEKMGADAVRIIIFSASASIKASDLAKKFKALACKVGTMDGEVNITESYINSMALKDFTDMQCEYIANFIIPSLILTEEGV